MYLRVVTVVIYFDPKSVWNRISMVLQSTSLLLISITSTAPHVTVLQAADLDMVVNEAANIKAALAGRNVNVV